jgi:hypothetical protein
MPPSREAASENKSMAYHHLSRYTHRLLKRGCGSVDLFQLREGRWREDLVADARDNGSIAFAVVANLVPSRIILKCRPPRLAICKRLPREYVG